MLTDPTWFDITLRLGLAAAAGVLVGYNREARSQAAGLRTTTLVCVSACLAMVLSALMLHDVGAASSDVLRVDVMRLPLGVLTGIGFSGAGAIVRRDDAVVGVATAATLWFMTIVGLVIGAGELLLGAAVALAGLLILWVLEWADLSIRRRFRATLRISAESKRLPEAELRNLLGDAGQHVVAWGVTYKEEGGSYDVQAELEWRGHTRDRAQPPAFVSGLSARPGVRQVDWSPQAVSA